MHEVVVYLRSIRGSGRVEPEAPGSLLFASHLTVDGEDVFTEGDVLLSSVPGFLTLELREPSDDYRAYAAKHGHSVQGLAEIRARFSDEQVLEGTDEERLLLPVRSISFAQDLPGEDAALAASG